jgi:hypothetical protein
MREAGREQSLADQARQDIRKRIQDKEYPEAGAAAVTQCISFRGNPGFYPPRFKPFLRGGARTSGMANGKMTPKFVAVNVIFTC